MTRLADWQNEAPGWPNSAASHFCDTGDCRWHVQRGGQGVRMLLLHGTGASTHSWAGLFPRLARFAEVLAPDLPGHAFTACRAGADFSLPGMASALQRLLTAEGFQPGLLPSRPSCLIALNGALRPLSGPAGLFGPAFAGLMGSNPLIIHALARAALDRRRVASLIRSTGSVPCQPYLDIYARLFATPGHVRSTLRMMAGWDLSRVLAEMKSLGVPIIQITGALDRAVSPEFADELSISCPGTQHIRLPGLGHLAHEEDPERIASIIRSETSASRIARSRKQA